MTDARPYDLFVSYAGVDQSWVEGYLLDALTTAGVRCYSEAAFALGVPRLLEFERALEQSWRVLLVISPAYLADDLARFFDLLAQTYGLETARWPVIPLILEPVTLPARLALLTALDATRPELWPQVVARLCAEMQRPLPVPAPLPDCPYPGMVPFREDDYARFFGREAEVEQLLGLLRLHPFLAVIGPSGSGKSSLVFAGLLPTLRTSRLFGPGAWQVCALRPGDKPLEALETALGGDLVDPSQTVAQILATAPDARRLLLIVDQFEELYALEAADAPRFQELLLALARTPGCYVLLTVRADFYADLMAAPVWLAVKNHRLEVVPLDEVGLRAAILRPAEQVAVSIESALVERLLADARGEPGVLPLIQETLVLLWARLERRFLPLAAYERLVAHGQAASQNGQTRLTGLQVAMARRADQALSELAETQQVLARRIFVRLVQFGEGRADTRRQQAVAELRASADDSRLFDQILEHLIRVRLLTASGVADEPERTVDIAHEALISGWPTLQHWLDERREAEQTRRRLEDKATEWVRLGRGQGGLLDAVELAEAERWLGSPSAVDLGYAVTLPELIADSRRELDAETAQRQRARRFQRVSLGVIVALVITALAVGLLSAQRNAEQQATAAATAQALTQAETSARATAEALAQAETNARATAEARRAEAERQTRIANARQLTALVEANREHFPQRSLLLGVEALSQTLRAGQEPVPAAETELRLALSETGGRVLRGHERGIREVAFSEDGHRLVVADVDGTAWKRDLRGEDESAGTIVVDGSESTRTVAFSADGRWLVTGDDKNTAQLWNLRVANSPKPMLLHGHASFIMAAAFSPDGHWLATGSLDKTARLWNLRANDPAATSVVLRGHQREISALAFSPDGHWLLTVSRDVTARLWDLRAADVSAEAAVVLPGYENVFDANNFMDTVVFSPDGHWLATGSRDGMLRLWDLWDGHWRAIDSWDGSTKRRYPQAAAIGLSAMVLRGPTNNISALAFSPNDRWLVTGNADGTAQLWDMHTTDPTVAPVVLHGHADAISAAAFSPDGRWLATSSYDATVRLWDLGASYLGTDVVVLGGFEDIVTTVVFSGDGHWLAAGSVDGTTRLWNMQMAEPGKDAVLLRWHEFDVKAVAFSEDGRWLATGGGDGKARLWDMRMAEPNVADRVLPRHTTPMTSVAFSADGRWLATSSDDKMVQLWNLRATELGVEPLVLRGHDGGVNAVAFSTDGRWLATGSDDKTIRLWDLRATEVGADPVVLRGHDGGVNAVAFSTDGRWLATGSDDKTIRLWDLRATEVGGEPVVLRGHQSSVNAVAFSTDGHWLATGSADQTVRLWNLQALNPQVDAVVLRGYEASISIVAFSGDGRWLATGSDDKTVRLWDIQAVKLGADAVVLRAFQGSVRAMNFTADGRWLVTGSTDGRVQRWSLRPEDLIEQACRLAGRNLTREEWGRYMIGQGNYRATCPGLPLDEPELAPEPSPTP